MESDPTAEHVRQAALELAVQALARRDLSQQALAALLQRAGVDPEVSAATVAALAEERLVDDRRFAHERAASLAGQGLGDAAIDARLAGAGLDDEVRAAAIAALAPEEERAGELTARLGARGLARTATALRRRGFSPEAIETALARLDADHGAELR